MVAGDCLFLMGAGMSLLASADEADARLDAAIRDFSAPGMLSREETLQKARRWIRRFEDWLQRYPEHPRTPEA
jgi:hypothetical protein